MIITITLMYIDLATKLIPFWNQFSDSDVFIGGKNTGEISHPKRKEIIILFGIPVLSIVVTDKTKRMVAIRDLVITDFLFTFVKGALYGIKQYLKYM